MFCKTIILKIRMEPKKIEPDLSRVPRMMRPGGKRAKDKVVVSSGFSGTSSPTSIVSTIFYANICFCLKML